MLPASNGNYTNCIHVSSLTIWYNESCNIQDIGYSMTETYPTESIWVSTTGPPRLSATMPIICSSLHVKSGGNPKQSV
jgi:hypothetical protein